MTVFARANVLLIVFSGSFYYTLCIGQCQKQDFSVLCPKGWAQLDDVQCEAPLSYGGPCDTTVNTVGFDDRKKQEFSTNCQAPWPCVADTCRKNYSDACPMNWIGRGNGACDAPLTYGGNCMKSNQMWDDEFKKEFEIRCNVQWPCEKTCFENFEQACPRGWVLVDGSCEAFRSDDNVYTGPCIPFANLANLTSYEKKTFAELCQVDFCESRASKNKQSCDPSNMQTCPDDWKRIGTIEDYCYGEKYDGPCRPLVSTSELNSIGKSEFMQMCAVNWHCDTDKEEVGGLSKHVESSTIPAGISGPLDETGRIHLVIP